MKLSRTVGYALRATLYLAAEEPNKPIPCSKIAKEGEMPERFLLQILRNLVNQGVLRSTRGVDGGYTLAGAPSDVSLLDIIEAIDGPISQPADDIETETANSIELRLDAALKDVSATMRHQLDAIKVAHLLQPPRSNSALVG